MIKPQEVYTLTEEERAIIIAMQGLANNAQKQLEGALLMLANLHGLVGNVTLSVDGTQLFLPRRDA